MTAKRACPHPEAFHRPGRGSCYNCEKKERRERRAQNFEITTVLPVPSSDPPRMPEPPSHEPRDLRRILLVPDCHVPYHDKLAFGIMLRAGMALRPDEVVVLGDFADFYSVSAHSKDPSRGNQLEEEISEVRKALKLLEGLGASKLVYVAGNHEDRLSRYLADHAPALWRSLSIPDALGLTGWHYVPYKDHYRLGKIHVTHDTGKAGRNANRSAMDAYQGSVIIGHTHRMEYSVMGSADGPPQLGAMFGWLGDFSRVDYMHTVESRRNWVHGFGVGYMEPASGIVHVQPVPIVNGACVVEGKLIR